jgi:hypothetical protein
MPGISLRAPIADSRLTPAVTSRALIVVATPRPAPLAHMEGNTMNKISQLSSTAAPSERGRGISEIVRQFTPNWFAVTMGAGVLALALNQFVSAIPSLHGVALALWAFNIVLFTLFSVLYGARFDT